MHKLFVVIAAMAAHLAMWCTESAHQVPTKKLPPYALAYAAQLQHITNLPTVLCELVTEYIFPTWKLQRALKIQGDFHAIHVTAISHVMYKNSPVLILGADENIWMCGLKDGEIHAKLTGHTATVTCIAYVPEHNILISGSQDRTIKFWRLNLEDLQQSRYFRTLQNGSDPLRIALSPCKTQFSCASDDEFIGLFWSIPSGQRLTSGKRLKILPRRGSSIRKTAWSSDGNLLFSTDYNDSMYVHDVGQDFKLIHTYSNCDRFSYSSTTDYLVKCAYKKSLYLYKLAPHKKFFDNSIPLEKIREIEASRSNSPTHSANGIVFSPSGMFLACICDSGTLKMWDTLTGKLIIQNKDQESCGFTLYFPSDDILITQADAPATLNVYCLTDIRSANL